jgi:predicted enzyme related to lactoylglutathione lyase
MKIKEIGFVGIPVTDIARARKFYEEALGLRESATYIDGKWVEYNIGNGTLAITNVSLDWRPSEQGAAAALEVEDFDAAIKELKGRQIRFAVEPFETPGCFNAVVHDPDGNKLMIHKIKPERENQ